MRLLTIRVLFLLISANVAYGTSGDIYAEKIQLLLYSAENQLSYKPEINADLFVFTRSKEAKRSNRQWPKLHSNLVVWIQPRILIPEMSEIWNHSLFQTTTVPDVKILSIRRLIFPRHFFL